jgi:hypothetical protein
VEDVAEQLDPVDQPRPRLGECGAVDRVDAGRAQCRDVLPELHRLRLRVPQRAFRHDQDDVGAQALQLAPADRRRAQPWVPGDVLAAGDRDHLRHPEAGDPRGIQALQRHHPRSAGPGHRRAHDRQPPLELAAHLVGVLFHSRRLAQPHDLFEHLAERRDSHRSLNIAVAEGARAKPPIRVAIFTVPNGRGRPSPKYRAA